MFWKMRLEEAELGNLVEKQLVVELDFELSGLLDLGWNGRFLQV